jgi:uncharacterized membrane protein HdeD (DUF308 family)
VQTLYAHRRVVLPLAAAVVCLGIAQVASPIVTWVLLIATFGFILDAVTMMWPHGDNLTKYRQ